ncbi:replication-relaxation family protein [Streptomyces sp. NPDC048489]|uniref:replication-relaxation family protein n=1 Tax=Streptomyces sp. NPDC048489 TaxID=3154504 RepID=UPI00341766D7
MTSERLSAAAIERHAARLSERDCAIILDLVRVRVLTGSQLTRLHFHDLAPNSRDRVRRNVLSRLISIGFVAALERQIGGVRAGSQGLIYTLDAGGQRALPHIQAGQGIEPTRRARKPRTPGERFLLHTLDVSELYVQLTEAQRLGKLILAEYRAEYDAHFPNGAGGLLKPDAYAVLRRGDYEDSWWIEVDRGTEDVETTLRRKLLGYIDFATAGGLGPDGVMPRVLLTLYRPKRLAERLAAVQDLLRRLPEPAERLVHTVLFSDATPLLVETIRG